MRRGRVPEKASRWPGGCGYSEQFRECAHRYGHLPQNPDIERAILGAILINPEYLPIVENLITERDFFVVVHRKVFGAMQKLAATGQPVELLTLCDALNDDPELASAGGQAYLAGLTDGLYGKAPVVHWARIIHNSSVLRQLAYAGEYIIQAALESNAKAEEIAARLQAVSKIYSDPYTSANAPLFALSAEDLLARDINPRQMLLDPVLPEQGLVMLYAYRGIGKTYIGLGIAAAVSSGGTFLRWRSPRPRKVLYVDGGRRYCREK